MYQKCQKLPKVIKNSWLTSRGQWVSSFMMVGYIAKEDPIVHVSDCTQPFHSLKWHYGILIFAMYPTIMKAWTHCPLDVSQEFLMTLGSFWAF